MSNNSSRGMSFAGVIQIIFIVLKLTGLVNWSWGVVLIPLWIDLILLAVILLYLWLDF